MCATLNARSPFCTAAMSSADAAGSTDTRIRLVTTGATRLLRREPLERPLACLSCLLFAVPRLGGRLQRMNQTLGGVGDFVDRLVEGGFIGLRRLRRPAQLANELQRGRADLVFGGGRLEVGERLDVPAHGGPLSGRRRAPVVWSVGTARPPGSGAKDEAPRSEG